MATGERAVRLSVLDRLMDDEPGQAADPPATWAESVRRYRASVLRDVEWLLNTRRTIETAPPRYPEVRRSLHHYGVPDVTSMSADASATPQALQLHVEEALRLFEPRLMEVRVRVAEAPAGHKRDVRFVVDALLKMDPEPERVIFDTVLETASGEFLVRDAADA